MKIKKIVTSSVRRKRKRKEFFQLLWLTYLTNKLRKHIQKLYKKTGHYVLNLNTNDFRINNLEQRLELLQASGQIEYEIVKESKKGEPMEFQITLTDLIPVVIVQSETKKQAVKKKRESPEEKPLKNQIQFEDKQTSLEDDDSETKVVYQP